MPPLTPLEKAKQLLRNGSGLGNQISKSNADQIQTYALVSIAESLSNMEQLLSEMNARSIASVYPP